MTETPKPTRVRKDAAPETTEPAALSPVAPVKQAAVVMSKRDLEAEAHSLIAAIDAAGDQVTASMFLRLTEVDEALRTINHWTARIADWKRERGL